MHDARFKRLLQEFFAEFFWLFFPTWAARFDFGEIEWLDKEILSDARAFQLPLRRVAGPGRGTIPVAR